MGCCVCNTVEVKKLELVIPNQLAKQVNPEFVDLSLSSDSEIPAKDIEDWRAFKTSRSISLNDSVGMLSTLLQSERKISFYSKPGSIVDSFVVTFPQNFNK
ncbi:hypothetical protein SteCoe_28515 [Stentor coeruleus]|uniref:Uncharacterized protein n=1 Tax=Stentor coeruleus TaxID=5963 RepID=A0A1R2B806_9CILI|nr:hypothetical protein SteCoe_28515 [Stentor coeruleus]